MRNTINRNVVSETGGSRHGVQAIARAAAVLRAVENAPGGLALGEIAAAAELPKSTAHRIVGALIVEELLTQGEDGQVRLGGAAARLASASRDALADRLQPILVDLRRDLDETVDLAVLDGAAVRFIGQVAAPRRLRAVSSVGESFPLHCTANGKALLAAMPMERVESLLPPRLPRFTAATIGTRAELLRRLDQVRADGVAFDREEYTEGVCAVSAAVSDGAGPTAAISVPVPAQRFAGREPELAAAVREAAARATALFDRE
jgi:DNA-binding IclR family transcriptional regulator